MNYKNWFKPGSKVKKWIALGVLGIFIVGIGMGELINHGLNASGYTALCLITIIIGAAVIILSFKMGMHSIYVMVNKSGINMSVNVDKLSSLVYEKRLLIKGPKIVVIGGGTGLSTMLRGLKQYTSNITAIVTVADDGGGSGMLREELGILPPGDIRNCLVALADTEPLMEELMQYRFTDGMLKGQSFGNLFIAAMNGISDNFEEAIKKMSHVLAVTGEVLPVTLADVKLFAELENGVIIEGESKIPDRGEYQNVPIKRVFIKPDGVQPLKEAITAIDEADAIVLGPGSLYTSIIPNLLVNDIVKNIENSNAIRIYVSNIMTQPGETTDYSVCDHIEAIQKCADKRIIDYAIVNNGKIPEWLYGKYIEDGATEVKVDQDRIAKLGIKLIEDNLVYIHKNLVRHNSRRLAYLIMQLILNNRLAGDKKRLVEFYYLNERMKEING